MERLQLEAAMEDKRQNLLRKELAWVRRGAQARSTKQKLVCNDLTNLKSRKPTTQENLDISVASTRLGRKIMEFNHVSKSYGDRCLIQDLDYTLARTDRIGIVGPNGIGKSTLINLIRGKN